MSFLFYEPFPKQRFVIRYLHPFCLWRCFDNGLSKPLLLNVKASCFAPCHNHNYSSLVSGWKHGGFLLNIQQHCPFRLSQNYSNLWINSNSFNSIWSFEATMLHKITLHFIRLAMVMTWTQHAKHCAKPSSSKKPNILILELLLKILHKILSYQLIMMLKVDERCNTETSLPIVNLLCAI